jgi:hypothetical protein
MGPSNKKHHSKPIKSTGTPPCINTALSTDTASQTSASLVEFSNFIELANIEAINYFLTTAASTLEGQNLELLWKRAFQEGQKVGLDEGRRFVDGMDIQEVLKVGVERGKAVGMATERKEWQTKGHGEDCVAAPAVRHFSTVATQTEPKTTASRETQTISIATTSFTTTGTQTETGTSQHLEIGCPTCVATSRSLALSENRKNAKFGSTGEIAPNVPIFSSPTLSVTSTNSTAPSTTTTALEKRSTTANFTEKHEKIEHSPISSQTTSKIFVPSIVGPTDKVTDVYASLPTSNDVVSQPQKAPTLSRTASSSEVTAVTEHKKGMFLRVFFEAQASTESPVPTTIVTDFETCSEMAGFTRNHQIIEKSPIFSQKTSKPLVSGDLKLEDNVHSPTEPTTIVPAFETRSTTSNFAKNHEKSPIFTQKPPEPPNSTCFSWAEDAVELPLLSMAPTKQLRDISGLRSPSKNPFSSLQRRRKISNKKRPRFINSMPQYCCFQVFPCSHSHFQRYHHHSEPPASTSLNWDQDPRLADLSNALQALGWVRR